MIALFTHKIPSIAEELLKKEGIETLVFELNSKQEIIDELQKHQPDILVCLLTDQIDKEVIDASKNLQIIATYSVGFNHIDVEYAKEKDIKVIHTPGVLTNTVAEHTLGLILATAQRIVEADRFVRASKFKGWEPELLLGLDLKGKTLGIIGAGRIGTEVAKKAHSGFGMQIIYHDIKPNPHLEQETDAKFYSNLDDMLPLVDVLSLHTPLLESTHHLINSQRLSLMKKDAILVNTSRGPVVKESDLAEALKNKTIRAVALDVFENEPEVHPDLLKLENVVLTPHIASASVETRTKMAKMVAEGIISVIKTGRAENMVESK